MKTIGFIGGTSWESTTTYYKIANETVQQKLGGLHSSKCILFSVDFAEFMEYAENGNWDLAAQIMGRAAATLESCGADFIVLCANTAHKMYDSVQSYVKIPIVHIADVTADAVKQQGISKVGLIGTKYTVQEDFYKDRLRKSGLEVLIPEFSDIELVNNIIYDELCKGIILESSKAKCIKVIRNLMNKGAQGVILGCTELGMLLKQEDVAIQLFDTSKIHAEAAALMSLD